MDNYVTGSIIKKLRENKKLTQKDLAELIMVSDKAISKWENGRGYPDIGILEQLSTALGVNMAELMTGNIIENKNTSANMRKMKFYVCPICGNIITGTGEINVSCCGITLPVLELEDSFDTHDIQVERIENDYYVSINHDMTKQHYISFIAYVTSNHVEICKLYSEQSAEARLLVKGHGEIYVYCNKHGLFSRKI